MAADGSVAIALEGVSKGFGKTRAVQDVTVAIGEGEFFSLLGPSGCGKTTTLRMIAGFEVPDEGRIVLQGQDVTSVSANHRKVNMVFQQYALFPHMSIYDNVAFGLKVKRVPRSEHAERVQSPLLAAALLERCEVGDAEIHAPSLTYSYIGIYDCGMARAATTADAFNAIAEPRRRQILDVLACGELPVNDVVHLLDRQQ